VAIDWQKKMVVSRNWQKMMACLLPRNPAVAVAVPVAAAGGIPEYVPSLLLAGIAVYNSCLWYSEAWF